jgi:multicomponent Na+:H+ antiporter subunit C
MLYVFCFLLFMIGLFCSVVKKNMVKMVIGIMIMEYAVNLFLIMLGYRTNAVPPIIEKTDTVITQIGQERPQERPSESFINSCVDPLPQAIVLTSVVISLGTLALMISLCVRIYDKYGTLDITEIRRLKG